MCSFSSHPSSDSEAGGWYPHVAFHSPRGSKSWTGLLQAQWLGGRFDLPEVRPAPTAECNNADQTSLALSWHAGNLYQRMLCGPVDKPHAVQVPRPRVASEPSSLDLPAICASLSSTALLLLYLPTEPLTS